MKKKIGELSKKEKKRYCDNKISCLKCPYYVKDKFQCKLRNSKYLEEEVEVDEKEN